jgi:uncharacterized protein YkwD
MNDHRHNRLLLGVVGFLMLGLSLGISSAWTLSAQADPVADSEELTLLNLINNHRASQGLPALALSPTLTKAADSHSSWMANQNCFSHQCSGESDYVQRMWDAGYPNAASTYAENIAAGQSSAADVLNGWKNSSGHNRNMLHSSIRAIGIARVYSGASTYGWYWTIDLASIDDTGSTPPPNAFSILDNASLNLPANQNYSYWFKAQGGVAPYIWKVSGKLPAGMKFRNCGELKGRARKAGDYTVTVIAKDKQKQTTSKSFILSVQNLANGALEMNIKPIASERGSRFSTELTVYNLAGKLLAKHSTITDLALVKTQLANGVYWAVDTARDQFGIVIRRELRKFIVQH